MSKVVAVGELTRYLANLISGDRALRNLAVKGEISNFKQYASGHCYFNQFRVLNVQLQMLFLVSCLEAVLPDCALGRRMAWR